MQCEGEEPIELPCSPRLGPGSSRKLVGGITNGAVDVIGVDGRSVGSEMADSPEEVSLIGDRSGPVGGDLLITSDTMASGGDATHAGDVEMRSQIGARSLGGLGDSVESRHTFFEHPVERRLVEIGDRFEAASGLWGGVDPTTDPLGRRAAAIAEGNLPPDGASDGLYLQPTQLGDPALGGTQYLLQLIRIQCLEVDRSIHGAVSLTPMTETRSGLEPASGGGSSRLDSRAPRCIRPPGW